MAGAGVKCNRKRAPNSQLTGFVCDVHVQRESDEEPELKRLFPNVIGVVLNEMNGRFSDCNSDAMSALSTLKPENKNVFLITATIAPLLYLRGIAAVEDFAVAPSFLTNAPIHSSLYQHGTWTTEKILEFCGRPFNAHGTLLAITRQLLQPERCSNPLRIQQVF